MGPREGAPNGEASVVCVCVVLLTGGRDMRVLCGTFGWGGMRGRGVLQSCRGMGGSTRTSAMIGDWERAQG